MTEVLPETPHPADGHQMPHTLASPPPNMAPTVAPASAAAHTPVHPGTHAGTHAGAPSPAHRGREKLHWGKEVWDRLDHAVRKEIERTRVAAKFLPHHSVPPHTTSVPADIVIVPTPGPNPLLQVTAADGGGLVPPSVVRGIPPTSPPPSANSFAVDEGATTRLIEFWVEFSLTPQQVEQEGNLTHDHQGASHPVHPSHAEHGHSGHSEHGHHGHSTAVTLATRAANILAQAEDMLMFDGLGAFTSSLYTNYVRWRANGEPLDWGLLEVIPALAPPLPPGLSPLPPAQVITVAQKPPPTAGQPPSLYGENTFQAVTAGYATLMGNGQYGPFALTLHNVPYADSFAPLPDTLIMPADRIAPLMTAGFRDSGTLDAPGATAAAAGAAAAAAVIAAAGGPPGSAATQLLAQQAAAQAAAGYAIDYGITVGLAAPVAVAATTAATAAAAALAPGGPIPAGQPGGPAPFAAPSAVPPNAMFLGIAAAIAAAQDALKAFPAFPVPAGFPDPTKLIPAPSGLPSYYGSLVSLGGNAMDLVVGIEPTVGFMQQDVDGNFRFRVVERVALRLKDITAVIRLEFL
jgi:hypothetical protein